MRKNFFIIRVTEHWNRLPREVVESSSMEIFKTHLNAYLCFGRGFGLDLLRSHPTPAIL